jgi:sugar-specific transcriptional regulator TrmB
LAATAGLRAQTSEAIANLFTAWQQVARAEHAASTSKAAVDSSSKANELLSEHVRELKNAMLVLDDTGG